MKIIHCADVHLDANLTSPNISEKERNKEIRNTLVRMFEYATENKVNAIIIAGDLLDSDMISEETRSILLSNIQKRSEIQFYYLRGNHDANHTLLGKGNIPANLCTFSENLKIYKTLLPNGRFISVSGLETEGMDSVTACSKIKLDPKDFNIVCLHGQIKEYAQSKRNGEFGLHQLENKNIHYLALGHVHKFQKGQLAPNGMYAYPGCLEGRGFDDAGDHGFILLDIHEETFSFKFRFVRFAGRNIGQMEIDVTELSSYGEIVKAIWDKIELMKLKNSDHLKVDLVGEGFGDMMELDYLEEELEKHFFKVRVNNRINQSPLMQNYQYDVSLRGEFRRILHEDTELDEEMKRKIMQCGISLLNEEY